MDNYSKVLTFFMEHGVQLTSDQVEALKEEFLEEKSNFDKYIDSKAKKAEEYQKKSVHYSSIADTSSGKAKDKAEQLADEYYDKAEKIDKTGTGWGANYIKQLGNEARNGVLMTGDSRARARDVYRTKAAANTKGGVDTENRQPGTFLPKK